MQETEELERIPANLQKAGYSPAWTSALGYPGEIPEGIKEFICPGIEQGDYLVGQLSSIFWLKSVEFLNELIQDPGHKLEDDLYLIKLGDGRRWFFIHKFPLKSQPLRKATGQSQFFRFFAPPLPLQLNAAKLKFNRNKDKFTKEIESVLADRVKGRKLYRGVTRNALVSLMALFCPVHSSAYADNEFGPGIYTSPSLEAAITYCTPSSALLIFEDPENLLRYTLRGDEWDTVVRFWTGLQVGNLADRVPPNWRSVDILEGSISREATGPRIGRVEGEDIQVVGVSFRSFGSLASALRMVIWFT
ncbi:uncharacterized protein N7506_005162 [Penicillium brevicompactum]|uniref:uncharacterized protein n=1 Tax=Penicillium brevicompactum TaxID=5074 RepID=UPI00254221B3|nr:uncharacterized protein N7506_005162 [Penicillium brevicompactum]KAJ5337140.1 hypothetical protein N7506_005162 [Penicillium brevicompactum]